MATGMLEALAYETALHVEQLFSLRHNHEEIHRRLAYDLQRFWEANDERMQALFSAFRLASVALVVEIVLLLVSVSDTLV